MPSYYAALGVRSSGPSYNDWLRYNPATKRLEYLSGSNWIELDGYPRIINDLQTSNGSITIQIPDIPGLSDIQVTVNSLKTTVIDNANQPGGALILNSSGLVPGTVTGFHRNGDYIQLEVVNNEGGIIPYTVQAKQEGVPGPQGPQGPAGPANTLTIGTVTTGAPGTDAGASITEIAPH